MTSFISALLLSFIILFIPLIGLIRKIDIFQSFVNGGKEGFEIAVKIIPFIVGIYVAIGMLQASGFFSLAANILSPYLSLEPELLSLAIVRPISGSGSIAILANIIEQYGPDSLASRTASTILGSTETTLYVIAVYFGAVSIKRYRQAIPAGLLADLAGIISSILICRFMFG